MTLLICGAGQYGLVAKEIAAKMNMFSDIIFLDDNSDLAVGKISEISKINYDAAVVAVGNPKIRREIFSQIKNPISLVHPSAIIMPTAKVGEGCIIEAGAVLCSNSAVGNSTFIMSNSVVGHDAVVGSFCQIKYNSTVSERTIVPDETKIDCNTVYS